MEEMLARWIRETIEEIEKAKKNQNLFKVLEMKKLRHAIVEMRDKLLKTKS